MGNKNFGILVKVLRSQRSYIDDAGIMHLWSQQILAQKSGISLRQIRRIEQSKLPKIHSEDVEALAKAFELNELEKIHFYRVAELIYASQDQISDINSLENFVMDIPFPSAVRTHLWDFVVVNKYYRILWGMTDEVVKTLNDTQGIGPNLLRLIFEDHFKKDNTIRPEPNWAAEDISCFRTSSLPFATTGRYQKIVNYFRQNEVFKKAWHDSENLPPLANNPDNRRHSISHIFHPEYGEMEFMSLRLPERYYTEYEVAVYVPTLKSETQFQKARQAIGRNRATRFRIYSLE